MTPQSSQSPQASLSLANIAARFGCEVRGDPDREVTHVGTLRQADARAIAFLANPAYRDQLAGTQAGAVLLKPEDADACNTCTLIHPDPYLVYAHVASELHPPRPIDAGVHALASVGPDCVIPASCEIAAGAVIADAVVLGERVVVGSCAVLGRGASVGDDSRVGSGVQISEAVQIGRRCRLHPGVVIGSDGFGNAREPDGRWVKVPQIGSVVIGDDVEIGANTTIDRGTIGDTVIGNGVRLDNQIQVAHNVSIGEHTAIAALTGIAGSARIGARCMIGGASGFAGHIEVTDDVVILAGTGVVSSIDKPGAYGGYPGFADEVGRWRRNAARYRQLDEMARRLRAVEKQLARAEPGE